MPIRDTRKRSRVNYLEVGSEGSDEEECKGPSTGSRSKRTRRTTTSRESKKTMKLAQVARSRAAWTQLLMGLPYDIFFELCNHSDALDLIRLAKVNKSLHRVLVKDPKTSRVIWKRQRDKFGFPLPDRMSEIQFAFFAYDEYSKCQNCGSGSDVWPLEKMFKRLCRECRVKLMIPRSQIRHRWPALHPEAVNCVTEIWGERHLIEELEAVQHDLLDLEIEDEIETARIESSYSSRRIQGGSRRHRLQRSTAKPGAKVRAYVRKCRKRVDQHEALCAAYRAASCLREVHLASVKTAAEQAIERRAEELVDHHGWCYEEVDDRQFRSSCFPALPPEQDPASWHKLRKRIQAAQRKDERWAAVEPYYQRLRDEQPDESKFIFPVPWTFQHFSSVKPFWIWDKKGSVLNEETWNQALPAIRNEINAHYETFLIAAARAIIAARRDVPLNRLSNKSNDYPSTTYDFRFFQSWQSVFVFKSWSISSLTAKPFPYLAVDTFPRPSDIHRYINHRQIRLIAAILEAAGFDIETDFGNLDVQLGEWQWKDHPCAWKRSHRFCFDAILKEVLVRGPRIGEIRKGKTIQLVHYPPHPAPPDLGLGLVSPQL